MLSILSLIIGWSSVGTSPLILLIPKSDLRTVYIQIFTLFKFDKNLKKYNRKTTLFIVK